LLDRHSLGALPALLHAAVQNHVDDLLAEDMREVCVPRRFRARNDEEHAGHKLPPRVKRPPSRPLTGEAERSDRAGAGWYRGSRSASLPSHALQPSRATASPATG